MAKTPVITLDLNFQGQGNSIAAYAVPHADGVVLIECGPGSTLPVLETALSKKGYSITDVTHVLLSHIHLDHAGAAGHLARKGADVYAHPMGAPHMLNPEKLIVSATRIYGDRMDTLWGEFLPVPENRLKVAEDAEEIVIGKLRFVPLATPGHANHHYVYLFEDLCFSGDVGGVRIPGFPMLRLPLVPPELHIELWQETIRKLQRLGIQRIAPTHFGVFDDAEWHLEQVLQNLEAAACWLEEVMPNDPPIEELRVMFVEWMEDQAREMGLSEEAVKSYSLVNPLGMSADGLQRYWKKFRLSN